ncbi:Cytosolic Fe-S cluster assembly factor NARFL [Trichinella pseudospiralis]|uniref:Cytosolic Fe-S cluster assembly factor NARFL n=1 Tax=Trichinella pseudospiralis TaxID=6337 RepID=A0A0V1EVZ9_TRIPS|nr:Cytosolic Fe-S cluster assembly factor NARFL [Trichinella pseudospiralis]KRZ40248.1 Cytosolic Fe-S cluster assembly factor NARFL [Trichinella pseudospiralis]
MSFSGTVRLTDLNDFIAPSQNCIKPILDERSTANQSERMRLDRDEINKSSQEKRILKPVSVTLDDCLACSGCITSAETVLIEQQGPKEFLKMIEEFSNDNKVFVISKETKSLFVVSISPQSRASLAASYNLTVEVTQRKLCTFLRSLGVNVCLDTTFARNFSLLATAEEFVDYYRKNYLNSTSTSLSISPLITAICPGWVCYAEKSVGDIVIPLMSKVRSPQAIAGSFVKDYLSQMMNILPNRIRHVTIMPCFDKKLEASRSAFFTDDGSSREVDLVLSTSQFKEILDEKCADLKNFDSNEQPNDLCLSDIVDENALYNHEGSGSGGYLEFVFKYAAKELFNLDISSVEYVAQRNKDIQEARLIHDNKVLFHMALCYGFRNIQNLIRKIRAGKCAYHFVEVMACPSGCLNGGGQIRGIDKMSNNVVEQLYHSLPTVQPGEWPNLKLLINRWLGGSLQSEKANRMLKTQYQAVKSTKSMRFNLQW